jgi:hypothetical protein
VVALVCRASSILVLSEMGSEEGFTAFSPAAAAAAVNFELLGFVGVGKVWGGGEVVEQHRQLRGTHGGVLMARTRHYAAPAVPPVKAAPVQTGSSTTRLYQPPC